MNCIISIFVCCVLIHGTGRAQSLTVQLHPTNTVVVHGHAGPDIAFRLQSSRGENWFDISDPATGVLLFRLDPSRTDYEFYRLRAWTIDDTPVTLAIIGDSTVADLSSNADRYYGWGQGIYNDMKPNVAVVNLAMPVHSTRNFLTSIQKNQLETIRPDYVLIQFGLVDTSDSPLLGTTLVEYETNLKSIVAMVRGFNGTPILITPTITRYFDQHGEVRPYLSDRSMVVRKIAAEMQTYLIDLNLQMTALYNQLGEVNSDHITWNGPSVDRTHFSSGGSEIIAEIIVDSFPAILQAHVLR